MVNKVLKFLRLADAQPIVEALPAPVLHVTEIGSTGSQNYSGYPAEEYFRTLLGRARADVFDKMRRSDSQVVMLLSSVKNPINAAEWHVEPYVDEETGVSPDYAKEDAALIKQILFKDMRPGWKQFVEEALTFCDFGFSVFEFTHRAVLNHPKFGAYNTINSMGFRSPRTIERWNLDRATGELASVSQYAFGDLQRLVDIPANFLLIYSLKKEGSNFEGVSLLRPCYGNFFRKDVYLKLNAVGIEKFAVPTPVAEVPEGKENSEQYSNLVEALQAYTQHRANYLTIPAGWKVTLEKNAYDPAKVEQSIDNEDKRMSKAFLANFLELGMNSSSGSFALSATLEEFFNGAIEHLAGKIEEPINNVLIPKLIEMNRGPREGYPVVKHSGISDKVGKELSEMYKNLADAQFLTPDDPTEAWLRKRAKMPPMSLQGQRKVKDPAGLAGGSGWGNAKLSLSERVKNAIKARENG